MIELEYAHVMYRRDVPRMLDIAFESPTRVEVSHRVPIVVDVNALTMRPAVESDTGETWDVEFVEEFGPRHDGPCLYTVRCVAAGAPRAMGANSVREMRPTLGGY